MRQRFLVAPLLGLLLLGVLLAAFIHAAQRQNALLTNVSDHHLAALDRHAEMFVALSTHHLALHDVLTMAVKLDEATLYARAKIHLNAIHDIVAQIDGLVVNEAEMSRDADFLALLRSLPTLANEYRATMTHAVEMATVDLSRANLHIASADERFIAMNGDFAKLMKMQRDALAHEIGAEIARSKAASGILATFGLVGASLLLYLSLALSRYLARALEAQVGILDKLVADGAGTTREDGDEVQRIGLAIEGFRRTQTRLIESETRFRRLFERSHAIMLLIEPDSGAIIAANESAARFYGYARTQFETLSIDQIDVPPTVPGERRMARLGDRNYRIFRHRLADGQERIVEVHATPVDTAGQTLLFSIIHDITERKHAEEALRKNQQLLQSILDHAGTVIFIKDLEGRYLLINQRFESLFGVTQDSLRGKTDHDFLPKATADAVRAADRRALAAGRAIGLEEEIPQSDGLHTYVVVKCPLYDENAKPYAVCGIATDITERKRVETALRFSEAALTDAQAVAKVGSWTLDLHTDRLIWSAETYRIFGLPADTVPTPAGFLARVHPQDRAAVAATWDAALRGQPHDFEHRILVGDEIRWVRECAHVRFDADGTANFGIGTVQDITELKNAQLALHDLNRDLEGRVAARTTELETASRAKSDFLANMSHEIRTPLNTILGMAHLALRTELAPKQRDYLAKIHASGQHLLELIDAILDFSKVEAGKLEIETATFEFAALMQNISSVCAPHAVVKGLRLHFDLDPEIPAYLRGDPLRLAQVLINLTNNAVKFTSRGDIRVSVCHVAATAHAGYRLRFAVQDTGIGMTAEEQARIFEAFQQADSSTTRKFGGTGLGLAISRQLVALMGGEIGVESLPGAGSIFWFAVPLEPTAGAAALPAPAAAGLRPTPETGMAARAALRGARILLADDHPFNQQVVQDLLEDAGAILCVANNGREALELLARERFDCVLMDVQMPEMDGLEATRRIRMEPAFAATPVIAMTANAWNQDRERCLAAGMDDFISKPIQPELLYVCVARWLARREAAPADSSAAPGVAPSAESSADAAFAGDPGIIDLAVPAETLNNDAAKIRRVALKFIETTRSDLPRISAALESGDLATLGAIGHRIKSPARALGAAGLANLCQALEALREGGAADQAADLVARLPPLLDRIAAAVEDHPLLAQTS